ncbi:Zeta toxin [Aureococcus anophagefferens]|uniref:Zeta toxin n=1 Tax=Aureococcus anophagefferens TaxID=44056 RepID=A0ABR1FG34_AURAN
MRTSELPRQSRLNVPLATLRKQKAMLERSAVTLAVKDAASQSALADVAAKSVTLEIARMLDTPFASAPPAWRLSETLRPGAETAVLSRGGRLDGAQFRYHAKAIKALWHAEDPGYWDYANKRGGRERRLRRIPPWLEGFDASRRLSEPPPPEPEEPRDDDEPGRPSLNGPAFATAAELGVEKPLMLETVRPRHYDVSWADGSPALDADGGRAELRRRAAAAGDAAAGDAARTDAARERRRRGVPGRRRRRRDADGAERRVDALGRPTTGETPDDESSRVNRARWKLTMKRARQLAAVDGAAPKRLSLARVASMAVLGAARGAGSASHLAPQSVKVRESEAHERACDLQDAIVSLLAFSADEESPPLPPLASRLPPEDARDAVAATRRLFARVQPLADAALTRVGELETALKEREEARQKPPTRRGRRARARARGAAAPRDAQDGDAFSSTASALMLAIRWRRRARQANERRESESGGASAPAASPQRRVSRAASFRKPPSPGGDGGEKPSAAYDAAAARWRSTIVNVATMRRAQVEDQIRRNSILAGDVAAIQALEAQQKEDELSRLKQMGQKLAALDAGDAPAGDGDDDGDGGDDDDHTKETEASGDESKDDDKKSLSTAASKQVSHDREELLERAGGIAVHRIDRVFERLGDASAASDPPKPPDNTKDVVKRVKLEALKGLVAVAGIKASEHLRVPELYEECEDDAAAEKEQVLKGGAALQHDGEVCVPAPVWLSHFLDIAKSQGARHLDDVLDMLERAQKMSERRKTQRLTIREKGLTEIQEARRSYARAGNDERVAEQARRATLTNRSRRSLIQRPTLSTADRPARASVLQRTSMLQRSTSTPAFLVRNPRASMVQRPAQSDDASDQSAPPDLEREPTPMPAALRDKYRKPPTPLREPRRRAAERQAVHAQVQRVLVGQRREDEAPDAAAPRVRRARRAVAPEPAPRRQAERVEREARDDERDEQRRVVGGRAPEQRAAAERDPGPIGADVPAPGTSLGSPGIESMGVFFADPPPRPPPPIRLEKARSFRRMKTQAPAFGDDEGREVFGGPRQESPMSGAQRALRRLSTMGAADDADDAVDARESEASVRASLCERMASRVADSLREPSPGLGASDAHAELRHVFDAIAEGGDSITEREFVALAAVLRLNLSPAECRRVWRQVDLQRTGAVSFAAFERAVRRRRLLRRIVAAYVDDRCDRDGDANAFAVPAGYDYDGSTRDNYRADAAPAVDASPAVAAARALVDAGYHGHYAAAREKWQNGIVESIAVRTEPQRRPWVVFTCGPMGAGKGHALSWLSEHGFFPLENIVHVDPDLFKQLMPEWAGYVARDPRSAGTRCHRESGLLAELTQDVAMQQSQHVWVDGSLRDGPYYAQVMADLRAPASRGNRARDSGPRIPRRRRERYPQYRLAIFYVTCSEATARRRAKARAERTGRAIPEALFLDSLAAPDASLRLLTPHVDFLARMSNEVDGAPPSLDAVEAVDNSGDFAALRRRFAHTVEPADPFARFPERLGPVGVAPWVDAPTEARLDGAGRLVLRLAGGEEARGSAPHVLALSPESRRATGCPDGAVFFAYVDARGGAGPLARGGLAWLGLQGDVLSVASFERHDDAAKQHDAQLTFGEPAEMPANAAAALRGRWRPLEDGPWPEGPASKRASAFLFLAPREMVLGTRHAPHGGVAFLFGAVPASGGGAHAEEHSPTGATSVRLFPIRGDLE